MCGIKLIVSPDIWKHQRLIHPIFTCSIELTFDLIRYKFCTKNELRDLGYAN